MRSTIILLFCFTILSFEILPQDPNTYSWRYYRPGNTGIQGDYNEAVWVAPDGDPYIGGYVPVFEEGGFSKFIQGENRWVNYSNVDYPVIGHPDNTGTTRVTDFVPEESGKLWIATWRGALSFDPVVGAGSLVRFGPANSQLADDMVFDIDRAPDGSLWFANQGIVRYDPITNTWMRWNLGNVTVGAQPKPTGGYLIWSSSKPPLQDYTFVFDSDTQQWTTYTWNPQGPPGQVVGIPGQDCVDDSGNLWTLRTNAPGDWNSLDYRRPDGIWVTPPEPYPSISFYLWAFKAYGDGRALAVDESGQVFQFNGSSWNSLGIWRPGPHTYSIDIDAVGNVWVCGIGGGAKYDVLTGQWQRYRITNTGNCDSFNGDLTIDIANNLVYTTANATAGVGGMVRFDGIRWTGWNQATYGLGYDWPFQNDNCKALTYRPSNGRIAVSPSDWLYGIHEWTGSGFLQLPGLDGTVRLREDTQGRLWSLRGFDLAYFNGNGWTTVGDGGATLQTDPDRFGTVWVSRGYEFVRTDGGTYNLVRTMADFPELSANLFFWGLAVEPNGWAWLGAFSYTDGTGLIHFNAETGTYQVLEPGQDWPFPDDRVFPRVVTPDGRLWMQYGDLENFVDCGLCWYDGTNVGLFPAPPGGEPQWGGLPHGQIEDIEVREISNGYELWMSCVSRGIAVLKVQYQPTILENPSNPPKDYSLLQNYPNPFNPTTTISFSIPSAEFTSLKVYDIIGNEVATLIDEYKPAGKYNLTFDASTLTSGVYLYRLNAGHFTDIRKMILLR